MIKKILLILLIIIAAAGIFLLINPSETESPEIATENNNTACQQPVFTSDITDLSKVRLIVPPGNIEYWGNEKILKTHSYIMTPERAPIYAPIDSQLYKGGYFLEGGRGEYALFFNVGCGVFYLFDHVHDPIDKIKNAMPKTPTIDTTKQVNLRNPIEIKAGELIGYGGGLANWQQWDFGVYNKNKPKNFNDLGINLYSRDKIAECPFDYYPESEQQKYRTKFENNINVPTPTLFCK